MRPRLLGGALQRYTHTIRHNPPTRSDDDILPLQDDEDWYPLYVLESSRHQHPTVMTPHPRDFISKTQFVDMTQDAWTQELQTMGIPFDSSATILQLLPTAKDISKSYVRYELPPITSQALSLEEALAHTRIVFQRLRRFIKTRRKIQRSLAELYRKKRRNEPSAKGHRLDDLLLELHHIRSAIAEHNERHQLLNRKTKALVKSTIMKMPKQVFVTLATPPIPTYNRFQLLSEEDHTHSRTKSWRDFIYRPSPQSEVGSVADPLPSVQLHHAPPPQQPMEAMAQLRRDLTTYGDKVSHQSPTHTHDVRGWFLHDDSQRLATLTVCTWNINGISTGVLSYKAEYISMIMQQDGIDVMICPDSRHSPATARSLKKLFVELLGAGTKTYFSKDKDRRPGDPGGIAIIIGPRWGPSYISDRSRTDLSNHGVLAKVNLRTTSGYIAVLGTYWPESPNDKVSGTPKDHREATPDDPPHRQSKSKGPVKHAGTESDLYERKLWPRILEYRKLQKAHNPDPITYLQDLTLNWIAKDRADGCQAFILGGDLNSTWIAKDKGGQRTINKWCEDNYLINGPRLIHDRFAPTPTDDSGIDLLFITWGRSEWGRGTWIDHLLHAGDTDHISIHGAFNALGADLDDVSDHKPLWAAYITAPPAESRIISLPKPAKRPELPRNDQRQIAMFKTRMSEVMSQIPSTVDTTGEAEEALELATAFSVQLTKEINERFQSTHCCKHFKRGHSPEFMLRKWHLCLVIELKRHLLGLQGKTRWTSHVAIQRGIYYMFQTIETRASSMGMSTSAINRILTSTSLDSKYWLSIPAGPTPFLCDAGIKQLKKLLHGRRRMDMRKASKGYSSWVESMREQGKIGRVIKATLGAHAGRRHQDGLTIEAIEAASGKIQGDPKEIHELSTSFAKDSFSIPSEWRTSFHMAPDWKPYVDDINLFLAAFEDSNIPTRYLLIIHRALQPIPQAALIHEELEQLLEHPPTLEDFKKGIRQTKANSAPGPSGLTNNMTKSWPESTVAYVHGCLSKFWTNSTIPAQQKWKWLHNIPKKPVDTPKLSDLRPLMLIEVLRKHWCSHIATTIKGVLLKHKALNDSHHGYIAGRGTGTASILHINLSEDAEEKTAALHRSSFDLRNAFGSVLNPAIDWCQRRLGIPQVVTRFMASMEENGTTVVKSEYAKHVWNLLPYGCVHTDGDYPKTAQSPLPDSVQISSFSAERGIGQGDPASPDKYNYHDDVIKTGMGIIDEDAKPTLVGAEDNDVFEQPDNGYADDMESASHSEELIQEKAELFSAFNIVLGLQFSPGKIRRLLQDYLPKRLRTQAAHMTIYTTGWIPQQIPIATTGSSIYLGGIYDLDNSYSSAMDHMIEVAKLHCDAIKHRHFSADCKILVATTSTVNKLRYTWETSSLDHDRAQRIDVILDGCYVQATKNMQSHPRKLLHIPRYLGGLGIIHFSAVGEGGKLQKLFGCMRSQQKHGLAARGILSRLCRKMGIHASPGQQIVITERAEARNEINLYGDSIRQWLLSHNLYLCRHGTTSGLDDVSTMLPSILLPDVSALRTTCHNMQLFNISDLTEESSTGRQWWSSPSLPEELKAILPANAPQGQPPLLVGQYWKLEVGVRHLHQTIVRPGDVVRIDGKLGDDVICQLYQYHITARGTRAKLVPGYIRLKTADLFHAPFAVRCILQLATSDYYEIQYERRQRAPAWFSTGDCQPPQWISWVKSQLSTVSPIMQYVPRPYTDGAFKCMASIEGYFRPHQAQRLATAAIIIKDDTPQWKTKPVIAVRITEGETLDPDSVYPMEFLALAGALQLTTHCPDLHDTGSDAQAILKLLPKRSRILQTVTRDHHYLLQCVDNSLHKGVRTPYHVKGHPESRKPGKDKHGRLGASWNKDDWGNWIADRLAANDTDILRKHDIQIKYISVSAMDLYKSLRTTGQWYIGDIAGTPVLPKGVAATVARSLASSYHEERDEFRALGGRPPTWKHDSSMEHAADVYTMRSSSASTAGTKCRIIYNKGYHGGNRAKDDSLTPEERVKAEQCLLCGQPDSQDHWLHTCPHRCLTRIRDDILAGLNRDITSYRDINPLHRQLGFAFKYVLQTTDQPSRIWTANWSSAQIQLLSKNFDLDLLIGLEMKDIRKILMPLEKRLAVGALSLWHTKVCEERRHRPAIERPPRPRSVRRTVSHSLQPLQSNSEEVTSPPTNLSERRPYLSRARRRKSRIHTSGTTVIQHVKVIQFPKPNVIQLNRISRVCHTDKSEQNIVTISLPNHGAHPIRGIEFQRICPNELGKLEDNGYFNDAIMTAYLSLVQHAMNPKLKVASSWATLQLVSKRYDEVMRALRYGSSRRHQSSFGHHKWIFFIFNITQHGKGLHFTCIGINTVDREYTYYDYAKWNLQRDAHMEAVKEFLHYVDSTTTSQRSDWKAIYDGTRDMVTQGSYPDCGPGTCFIIEAIASNISLTHFTVEGIHQGRKHFAVCLLRRSVPPLSTSVISTVQSVIQQPESAEDSLTVCDINILNENYVYDPYQDDLVNCPETVVTNSSIAQCNCAINIPSLTPTQIEEVMGRAGLRHSYESLRPASALPLIGTDLQDLIAPGCITDVLLQQCLTDALGDRTDYILYPAHLTRFILSFYGVVTSVVKADKRYEELEALQTEVARYRYVIFICWEYGHFTGIIVDKGVAHQASVPTITYLDSLKGNGDKQISIIRIYVEGIGISDRPCTICEHPTGDMIKHFY